MKITQKVSLSVLLYVYPNKEFYLDFYDRGGRGGDAGAVKGEFVILSR